ncbi:Iron(3+)-hydroxamate import ATP-binding protein FhuC [Psychrobacter sp. SC65A.3]|uniref:ABC transporter ATP-binding protein n=1 Tax=Psychrobacter sp. SC65A.3 TaxID=2983299 RepID=UPI0021D97AC4|nr:ABC transporter ATP-binding protein [Psychrobacter sp. SC65A.3]WAI88370.1 Iron(3+)-hydroxamate import ATP-binding protein FhuC [Psychrobacter sp. SC65A.3]
MMHINNLSLIRQKKVLLHPTSFIIEPNKLYALIGHNGSGKSSLIKAMAGEMTPTQGGIEIESKDLRSFSAKRLATHLAYLPQNLPDAGAFTVYELVMLGRYPHQKWLQKPTADDHQQVEKAISLTQVDAFRNRQVSTLSGGERARVWLAMCLAQQTKYLLLDEPLAALDVVYQIEVLKLIRQLVDEQGLGVVIILHDLNLAARFCDEFIALKQGQLCHMNDVKNTMEKEVLRSIFDVKFTLLDHPITSHKVAVI